MNRNPLVPTPIVDSRGRQTTVHKRVETGTGSTPNIPMVGLGQQKSQDNCHLIVNLGFESDLQTAKISKRVRAKMMDTLNPDTLRIMEDLLRDHDVAPTTTFRTATYWCIENRNFAVLNGHVALVAASDKKDSRTQWEILYSLRGLQMARAEKTPEIDITSDDERARAGRIYVKTMLDNKDSSVIRKHKLPKSQYGYTPYEVEVGTHIIDRPDHAQEILDLYQQRGFFDREMFDEILNNGASALNEGAL